MITYAVPMWFTGASPSPVPRFFAGAPTPNTMTPPRASSIRAPRRAFREASLATLLSCLVLANLTSQTAAAPTAADQTEKGDEPLVLSPFVVSAEDANGYQATSTLAGTRLRSDLKDVAAPISVFTPELLRDVAASNFQEAMLYSVNVENENEYAPDDTEGESISSTTQTRIRGLAGGTQTRGFFKTNFRADAYNIDRFTAASGPNSILFGIGSPAGVLDATPIMANLANNSGLVSFRVDNFGSFRANGDYNAVVLPGKLAVRVAALDQKMKTFREPEFDDEDRRFVTLTAKPFSGTTIRAEYEHMSNHRVRARDTLMEDNVTGWIALGKPLYDFSTGLWTLDQGQTWQSRSDLATWRNTGGIGSGNRVYMAGGSLGGDSIQGLIWSGLGLSYDLNRPYVKSFTDDSIVSSEINYYGLGDRTFLQGESGSVVLEQKITDDFHVELAWQKERNTRRQDDPLRAGLSSIQADVNYYRPYPVGQSSGTLVKNPNAGRYFIESEYLGWLQDLDYETRRALATYTLDFAKHGRDWLGKYTFGAMRQLERKDNFQIKRRLMNTGSAWIGADGNNGPNNVRSRYYLDIPGLGGDASGVKYPGDFVRPPWPTVIGGLSGDGMPSMSRTDDTGSLAFVQASLFQENLVLTYGYRHDKQEVWKATYLDTDPNTREYLTEGVGLDPDSIVQSGITRTFGAVYHTPLKWLSLLYNRSNAFNPQGSFRDWFNNPLQPGTGEGEDYGISANLLDGQLQFRLTRYTNTSLNTVELDWYYEMPKWSVVSNMDADWGMVTGYARRLGNTADIHQVDAYAGFSWDNVRATRDFKSEGYEAELFYAPTKQLDLRLTVSQSKATNLRIVPLLQEYVAARYSTWEKYFGYPAWGQWDAVMPAWNPNWATTPGTTGYNLLNWDLPRVDEFIASEGTATTRGRKWRVNLIGDYRFEGRLNGVSTGGAVRWRSADTIGYHGMDNPRQPGGPQVADISRPIHGDESLDIDAWIGYGRKFDVAGHKLDWSVQLNVRNLFNGDDFVPLAVHFDGTPTAYARHDPRTVILTNTFKF